MAHILHKLGTRILGPRGKWLEPLWPHEVAAYVHTLWWVVVNEVRLHSEHEFLQDDSEAVDVSFLSSVDRSSCHTQQLRCCPQLITVKCKLAHLRLHVNYECTRRLSKIKQ